MAMLIERRNRGNGFAPYDICIEVDSLGDQDYLKGMLNQIIRGIRQTNVSIDVRADTFLNGLLDECHD